MNDTAKKVWGYRHVILGVVWLLYLINYFDRIRLSPVFRTFRRI